MRSLSNIPAVQLRTTSRAPGSGIALGWHSASLSPGGTRSQQKVIAIQGKSAPVLQNDDLQRLEAVLFLAREPLTSRKLSQFADLADGTAARTLIRRLNEQYDDTGRAFRVEQVAGGYQLFTRRKFAPWLRRLGHTAGETRLSAPALETLAIIAYRQPVLRADIEAIRGVNCGEILRQLMERDLVRIDGRSDELGRPYLYSTTRRFLNLFGLVNLDELPRAQELRESPIQPGLTAPQGEFLDSQAEEEGEPSSEEPELHYTSLDAEE